MTPKEFHARIRQIAKEYHFTIAKLEQTAGLTKDTIKDWKTSYPSIEKVLQIANTLHVSLDYLVGNKQFLYSDLTAATIRLIQMSEEAKLDIDMVETIEDLIKVLVHKRQKQE